MSQFCRVPKKAVCFEMGFGERLTCNCLFPFYSWCACLFRTFFRFVLVCIGFAQHSGKSSCKTQNRDADIRTVVLRTSEEAVYGKGNLYRKCSFHYCELLLCSAWFLPMWLFRGLWPCNSAGEGCYGTWIADVNMRIVLLQVSKEAVYDSKLARNRASSILVSSCLFCTILLSAFSHALCLVQSAGKDHYRKQLKIDTPSNWRGGVWKWKLTFEFTSLWSSWLCFVWSYSILASFPVQPKIETQKWPAMIRRGSVPVVFEIALALNLDVPSFFVRVCLQDVCNVWQAVVAQFTSISSN